MSIESSDRLTDYKATLISVYATTEWSAGAGRNLPVVILKWSTGVKNLFQKLRLWHDGSVATKSRYLLAETDEALGAGGRLEMFAMNADVAMLNADCEPDDQLPLVPPGILDELRVCRLTQACRPYRNPHTNWNNYRTWIEHVAVWSDEELPVNEKAVVTEPEPAAALLVDDDEPAPQGVALPLAPPADTRDGENRYSGKQVDFCQTREWLYIRGAVLRAMGAKCMACGATREEQPITVDHIKPRSTHPILALDPNNLQVLCRPCNQGKGSDDTTDYRTSNQKKELYELSDKMRKA